VAVADAQLLLGCGDLQKDDPLPSVVIQGCGRIKMGGTQMERMTSREYQVAMLVARGLTNKEIALQLGVTEGTVKTYVHSILRKVAARNRYALGAKLLRCECRPADNMSPSIEDKDEMTKASINLHGLRRYRTNA
jgi:DNA-binding CsgD family transcriptional regulator